MNLLDFIEKRKTIDNESRLFLEGFNEKSIDKALVLITDLFKKNINKPVLQLVKPFQTSVGDDNCYSILYLIGKDENPKCLSLNFKIDDKSHNVYSISIFDNLDLFFDKGKAKLTIYTLGNSIVYFMPLIYHIMNTGDYNVDKKDMEKYARNILKESSIGIFNIGHLEYRIFRNINEDDNSLKQLKKDVYSKAKDAYPSRKENTNWKDIMADYEEIKKAIAGGATSVDELDVVFKSNVVVKLIDDAKTVKAQEKVNAAKESFDDPEFVWKEMRQFVKMVIRGINPSVIICGAPGVGKTFRVKDLLRGKRYQEGDNLWTIKGKCTPRQLYIALYNFQKKGDIILIDDADSIVGPKAPEDVINILKAALDSTSDDEGRLVSYGVSGKLEDDEGVPIPKKFYYNGGVIVITNYNAGQLDTALRGRSYIQDINFTLEDILKIIKGLLPKIDENVISKAAKLKAYDYIEELAGKKGNDIEISIRTFQICAKLFDAQRLDDELTNEEVEEMIAEQLSLQAKRGGKKY